MSASITKADKAEKLTSITLEQYNRTFVFESNSAGGLAVSALTDDPAVEALDTMLQFAQPGEDECPPREVTLQSVIDKLQEMRDGLNESWGENKGDPRRLSVDITIDNESLSPIRSLMGGGDISYDTRTTLRKALTDNTEW